MGFLEKEIIRIFGLSRGSVKFFYSRDKKVVLPVNECALSGIYAGHTSPFPDCGAFSPVPGLPGWSFLMTYLRGKLAPSAVLLGCASEPGLPPQISHKKTAPSRQSLRKDLIPSLEY